MNKNREVFLSKLEKLLDCEGVIILKGTESFINFLRTFFPEVLKDKDAFYGAYKLKNMRVIYAENPVIKTQTIVVVGKKAIEEI